MGTIHVPSTPELHVKVDRELQRRIAAAAKAIHQPMAAWVRIAIVEKLERDK